MPDPMMDPATQQNAPAAPAAQTPQPPPPPDMEAAPPMVKPDGGVLGHAALGALKSAATPPDMEAAPPPMEAAGQSPATPSTWDTIKRYSGYEGLHNVIDTASDYYKQQAANRERANLNAAAGGKQSPYSSIGTQALRDVGGVVEDVGGVATPQGAAMAVASTNPIGATAVGLYMVGHGLYNMVQGWGDVSNPDVLQNELNSAAEVVGGGAGLTEGSKGVVRAWKNKTANTPDLQFQNFKNAVPPTKTAPYTEMDYQAARPYLDAEHTTGTPIDGVATTVDAADSAIEKIEGKVASVIKATPDTPAIFKGPDGSIGPIDPLGDVQLALQKSVRADFVKAGMDELAQYPQLNPAEHGPLTLQEADDIRRQLNDQNRSLMKSKNNYDIANMMTTDPAFAARQAAAEALRTGVYDTLEQLGLSDARQMRLDEGSLIKIRNAAERQRFNAEKSVKSTAKPGLAKKAAKKAAVGIGAAAGFEMGSKIGHPLIGSSIGAEMGSEAASALTPKALTRDELIQKAFEPIPKPAAAPGPLTAPAGTAGVVGTVAHELPKGYVHVRGADGSEHFIPQDQLNHAQEIDPALQIVQQ